MLTAVPPPIAGTARAQPPASRAPALRDKGAERHPEPRRDVFASAVRLIQPRLLAVAEAADYLNLNVDIVRQLIESGALEPVRVPRPQTLRQHKRGAGSATIRRTLIDVRDLDRLVDGWKGA